MARRGLRDDPTSGSAGVGKSDAPKSTVPQASARPAGEISEKLTPGRIPVVESHSQNKHEEMEMSVRKVIN